MAQKLDDSELVTFKELLMANSIRELGSGHGERLTIKGLC
jgi:hypothetical protein